MSAVDDREPAPTPRRPPQEDAGEPPDVAGQLVDGVTAKWGPHAMTLDRARDLGLDLVRWPLDEPAPGWEREAACRGCDSEVADQLTEALSQFAATPLVSRLCSSCPVRTECFAMGRSTAGHGVHGGVVLQGGRVAPWRTAVERAGRARLTEANEEISTEITSPNEEISTEVRRGQRVQPHRLTRARRRGRRHVATIAMD